MMLTKIFINLCYPLLWLLNFIQVLYTYLVKFIFGCKGPDHLQLMNKNHMAISYWLDSIQLDQGLAQLSSKHFSAKFGSTQLSSRDFWLNSAQLEKLPARTKPSRMYHRHDYLANKLYRHRAIYMAWIKSQNSNIHIRVIVLWLNN